MDVGDHDGTEFLASEYDYTFNYDDGILTFNNSAENDVFNEIKSMGSEVWLKVCVEKYRSIDDLRGMQEEDVKNIAAAQAIHASIMEYMYQLVLSIHCYQNFLLYNYFQV